MRFIARGAKVLGFGSLLVVKTALAEVAFDSAAPEECRLQERIQASVLELTGKSLEEQTVHGTLHISLEIAENEPSERRSHLTMALIRSGDGFVKEFHSPDCDSVISAAGTALALLLEDPTRAPAGAASAKDDAIALPTSAKQSAETTIASRGVNEGIGVRASLGVDLLLFPEPTPTTEVGFVHRNDPVRFELNGLLLPSRAQSAGSEFLEFSLLGGILKGCFENGSLFLVSVCVQGELGRIAVSRSGGSAREALWLALGPSVSGGLFLGKNAALRLEIPLLFPLLGHEFQVAGTPVHRIPLADVRPTLSLELGWW